MELRELAESLSDTAPGGGRMPKYLRLSEEIANAIDRGGLQVGDRLPGESEMADALPASLGTVQKALARLVERGVVVRRHGLGTFVAGHRMAEHDLWHFRFVADDGVTLLPVYTRVSAISRLGDGPWADVLAPAASFVAIDRLIDINHEFTATARLVLDGERFSDLLGEDPRQFDGVSIRKVMGDRFGVPTLRFSTEVGAETLPDDARTALSLAAGSVGLVCRIIGYGFRDTPVSYQTVCAPPNARRLKFLDFER